MSTLRQSAAALLFVTTLGATSIAEAAVHTERGDAGGRLSPQATIGSGPLGEIKGTIGELLPASQLHDLIDAFTFKFIAAPDPTSAGLLLPARLDLNAGLLLPAVRIGLTLLDELGNELAEAQGDGSVRIFYEFLPAVQNTTFHVELEILEALDPPYTIAFAATNGIAVPFTQVPEPESYMLLGAALIGLGLARRRLRRILKPSAPEGRRGFLRLSTR